ncbi:MAG: Bifunctional protein GlmU [Candidatus Anoxychlamydiales bacterium]|nr:Bifunctional protein GlmU [Candidatus Anoxychlamydiales bacterium]NGX35677.1 Bifunctional protein GlmU [Candidatus Anoxychlamydiales bacterium]
MDINNFFDIEKFSQKEIFENIHEIWLALVNIEGYLKKLNCFEIRSKVPSTCHLENRELIYIGENTIIEPYSYIKGPCHIGDNSQIRHSAYIRGNVITGDNCIIGHATEIKNSILFNNVNAAHFAYIGDSILGNNVNLGAGVKCANFRLDKKMITFYLDGKLVNTNLEKLGAIIGDNTQIGCNSVLNPATFLEKNVKCFPNTTIGGWVLKNSKIFKSNKMSLKKITIDNSNEPVAKIKK